MVITVCSLFRDSTRYLDRYFTQVTGHLYHFPSLRFVLIEGDSKDRTYDKLREWASGPYSQNVKLMKHDQGTPHFGSVVDKARFKALSELANLALNNLPPETDYVLWLESDLIVPPDLVNRLSPEENAAKAPYVLNFHTKDFYDTWAFRNGGQLFSHKVQRRTGEFEVDSAGSVLLIPYKYIKDGARFTEEEVVVGLCKNLRRLGCKIKAVPNLAVYHP